MENMIADRPIITTARTRANRISSSHKLRRQCQEQLALHIESRIGYAIDSSKVRLSPSRFEPYTWKILRPDVAWLFSKRLSAHNAAGHREILAQIGIGFEACIRDSGIDLQRSPTCTEATHQLTSMEVDQLYNNLASALSKVKELQKRELDAEATMSQQGSLIFQCNMTFDRIAQVLEEHRCNQQLYIE